MYLCISYISSIKSLIFDTWIGGGGVSSSGVSVSVNEPSLVFMGLPVPRTAPVGSETRHLQV